MRLPRRIYLSVAISLVVAVGVIGWLAVGRSSDGQIQIDIAGLPAGTDADVIIQGAGRSFNVTRPTTVDLPPGRYLVTTNPVAVPLGAASGRAPQEVTVSRGITTAVLVAYVDVVGPRTRVADRQNPGVARVDATTVYLDPASPLAATLKPGDYLVAGATTTYPMLVRRADAVQMEGNLLRVGTSPALLAQAMPRYEWIITDPPPPLGGQGGSADPLIEIDLTAIIGETRRAERGVDKLGIATDGCETTLPGIVWKLWSLDPDISGKWAKTDGGSLDVVPDGFVEKGMASIGVDASLPDGEVNLPGVETSLKFALKATHTLEIKGELSGDCYVDVDVIALLAALATEGAGGTAVKMARTLSTLCKKAAENYRVGRMGLNCDLPEIILRFTLAGFRNTHVNLSTKGDHEISAEVEVSTSHKPKARVHLPGADDFSTSGPGFGADSKHGTKDVYSGATLTTSVTWKQDDPWGGAIAEFEAGFSEKESVELVMQPGKSDRVVAKARVALNAKARLAAFSGQFTPVNFNSSKWKSWRPVECIFAGPWFPFGPPGNPADEEIKKSERCTQDGTFVDRKPVPPPTKLPPALVSLISKPPTGYGPHALGTPVRALHSSVPGFCGGISAPVSMTGRTDFIQITAAGAPATDFGIDGLTVIVYESNAHAKSSLGALRTGLGRCTTPPTAPDVGADSFGVGYLEEAEPMSFSLATVVARVGNVLIIDQTDAPRPSPAQIGRVKSMLSELCKAEFGGC